MARFGFGNPGQSDDTITDQGVPWTDGKAGDDTIIWSPALGGGYIKGGAGVDTLVIALTGEEWLALAPTLQPELDAYLAFLDATINPFGLGTGQLFSFESLGIDVKQFEAVELEVDGSRISAADDPVVAEDDGYATPNDTPLAGNVLENDSLPDLLGAVTLLSAPTAGALVLEADGSFSFDPGTDFDDLTYGQSRDVTFTYQVTDADGDSDTATVTLTVEGTNTPPVAEDDVVGVAEGTMAFVVPVLNNDSDIDGDPLTITEISGSGASGSLSLVAGDIIYHGDPALSFLGDGQTFTDVITYTITDGNGGYDTAQLSVTYYGTGPTTQSGSASGEIAVNAQDVTISLTVPTASEDGTGDYQIGIDFGAVAQPTINVIYIVDTSGSTGTSGGAVLAAEIAALQYLTEQIEGLGYPPGAVTINLVPFSTTAAPDATGDAATSWVIDPSDDGGGLTDVELINQELASYSSGGFTNYVEALEDAALMLDASATNVVYFISDGRPVSGSGQPTQTLGQIEAAAAVFDAAGAVVSAVGIELNPSNPIPLQYLDAIDNTGGAEIITDAAELGDVLVGTPIPEGTIVSADVFIFAEDGVTLIDSIALDPGDFTETLTGFSYSGSLGGLADDLGELSTVQLSVGFDGDGDGLADLTLTTELDVMGY